MVEATSTPAASSSRRAVRTKEETSPQKSAARSSKRMRATDDTDKENSKKNVWGTSSMDASMVSTMAEEEDACTRIRELEEKLESFRSAYEQEEKRHQVTQAALAEASAREKSSDAPHAGGEAERMQRLVNDKRKLALEVQTLKEEKERAEARARAFESKVKEKDVLEAAASGKVAPLRGRARAGGKSDDSDSDAGKALEQLHAKEEELKQAQVAVKDLQGKLAQMSKSSATASLSLEKALKSGEVLQMKLKAAEKAGAEAEKKLASAHVRISELEAAHQSAKASTSAVDELQANIAQLQDASTSHVQQLQARADEVSMLKKELSALKAQLVSQEKMLSKQAAEAGEGDAAASKSRKRGRYSIADTDSLMDKFGQLQGQFLEMSKANAAAKSVSSRVMRQSMCESMSSSSVNEESSILSVGLARESPGTHRQSSGSSSSELLESKEAEIETLNEQITKLSSDLEIEKEYVAQLDAANTATLERVEELHKQLATSENARRRLHNQVIQLQGNIRVFCRVRPFMDRDGKDGDTPLEVACLTSGDRPVVRVQQQAPAGGRKREAIVTDFELDQVFMHDATQASIFGEIEPLLQSVMDGYRLCIFAYGQTGSGKTHTMQGCMEQGNIDELRGVVPRAFETIMLIRRHMQSTGWEVLLEVNAVEIYNEVIRDLLSDDKSAAAASARDKFEISTDGKGEVIVRGLKTVSVESEAEIYALLDAASKKRETASTCHNQVSSRSHSVLTLKVSMKHKKNKETRRGVLNLIDLAGSEKVTGEHDKKQLDEARNINTSLSALLGVVKALASKAKHVPFRDSKLTHLLSSSLSGDGKALMFANLSPKFAHVAESVNTLRFASDVNKVQLGTGKIKDKETKD